MKDISFLLPTNRDYNSFSKRVVDNINSLEKFGMSYEIILISPFDVNDDNVINVKDPGDGCVEAYNLGFKNSTGRYIILASDDHYFDHSVFLVVNEFDSDLYKNRKYKIISLPTNNHGPCKLPEYCGVDSIIARYPVFERKTVINHLNGYIYNPKFKHHYPDNWLGYWLHSMGEEPVEYFKYDMITFFNACEKKYDEHDETIFKSLIEDFRSGNKQYA